MGCRWIVTGKIVLDKSYKLTLCIALGPDEHLVHWPSSPIHSAILAKVQITDTDGLKLTVDALARKKELLAALEPVGLESYKPMQDLYAVWIETGPGKFGHSSDDRKKEFRQLYGRTETASLYSAACVLG